MITRTVRHMKPRRRRRRRRILSARSRGRRVMYDLQMWLRSYLVAVASLLGILMIAPAAAPFCYLLLGWWLSRQILGNVVWMGHLASVGCVAREKAKFIVSWPVSVPKLCCVTWFARRA